MFMSSRTCDEWTRSHVEVRGPTFGSWFFPFTVEFPGTEHRSADLAAGSRHFYPQNHLNDPYTCFANTHTFTKVVLLWVQNVFIVKSKERKYYWAIVLENNVVKQGSPAK